MRDISLEDGSVVHVDASGGIDTDYTADRRAVKLLSAKPTSRSFAMRSDP